MSSVPFREIALTDGASFQVYDTSGPYSDAEATIDVKRGLLRADWIAARGGVEPSGRAIKGRTTAVGIRLRARLQGEAQPLVASHPVTQLELARAGIVTKEMVYIAHRENIGRARQADEAKRVSPTARASARRCPPS